MDNLQWFKFSPSDWMMGRIQRQPAQVQVDFLRVCCQYWKNEGNYAIEDAKLECMETYDTLVKYKIIKEQNGHIQIDFLDEQLDVVELKRQQASEAGKRSAETRKRKTKDSDRSTTVQPSFNDRSTESNRVEKSREEKSREEKSIEDQEEENNSTTLFDVFWKVYDFNSGLRQAQEEWMRIEKEMPNEIPKIMANVPLYVASKQDKNFRKKPENYLKERVWMDEIVISSALNTKPDSQLSDEELCNLTYDEIRKVKDKQMRVRYCDLKGIKQGGYKYSNIVELNSMAF